MTDRSVRRARRAVPVIALGLLLAGCSDGGREAGDPAPTPASSPTETGTPGPGDDPCAGIDTDALTELTGLEYDDVTPYEKGPDAVAGCLVSSSDGYLAVQVDVRDDHGSLEADLADYGTVPRNPSPSPATIAGLEALTASGEQQGVTISAAAMHLEDDRLLVVSVTNFFAEDLTAQDGVDLASSVAEMVVPAT